MSNERYARADQSVTGQVLKIVALHPDAVMTGGSGTPGALPFLALAERGFKGGVYGQHGLINPDFIRVAGASGNGALMPDRAGRSSPSSCPTATRPRRSHWNSARDLPEGQRRADDRRLLGLLVRRAGSVFADAASAR